jgi:hypothetical protein
MDSTPPNSRLRLSSADYIDSLGREFPGFRIVPKAESSLNQWIDRFLRIITFGAQARYLSHYHTVIGNTLYVPPTFEAMSDIDRIILLRHERVHLLQRRRLGFVLMALIYLIPFLPVGLAYGRARLEWEAYVETLRATAELKGSRAAQDPTLRAEIIQRFTGPDYAWMWPFPKVVGGWYDQAVEGITRELNRTSLV